MRRSSWLVAIACFLALSWTATAATGRVMKVLPHFLDLDGKHTLSPSLYDRDAYQAFLRDHPLKRGGIRFDIHWLTRGEAEGWLKIRVELRGVASGTNGVASGTNLKQMALEASVKPAGWFGHWTSLPLQGEAYKNFGEITAWRVTLWEKDQLLSEQKSFLW